MCQNGIVFILVSLFCYGLGAPLIANINETLSTDLLNLSKICKNAFLVELIKSKIDHCNVLEQSNSKKDYECLMFYDINRQLCETFDKAEVDLKENFEKNINATLNIDAICDDAVKWKSVTTNFKKKLEDLVKHTHCLQVCAVEDVVSDDANFYCKYFKWGSDMILSQTNSIIQSSSVNAPTTSAKLESEIKSENVPTNNAVVSQSSYIESLPKGKDQLDVTTKLATPLKKEDHKEDIAVEVSPKSVSALQKPEIKENIDNKMAPGSLTSKSDVQKPIEEPQLKSDLEKENQSNQLKPVVENSQQKAKLEDNFDESENDLEPDDGPFSDQENMEEDDLNADPKIETEKSKENSNINKLPLTSFNVDVPQRDIVYANTIQDTFVEEDDHFFPFFLTTIVLVVLLYILYHNKSKVTKVILGLIVEGRQSNRRRNSRGHAYRRLDTLEQAMTASTTAPPSKIIY